MKASLLKKSKIKARDYQENMAQKALEKNTLVVLPTGMGKTLVSVLVAVERLKNFPKSKVLITAPTRPLNAQHRKSFEELTKIPKEEIVLVTGKISPDERRKIYENAKIIVATPETIRNDLELGRLNFKNFSFVTFDESHRAMKDYAYSYIAKKYMLQSENPLILGLTASPGGKESKIREICDNLFIKAVEVRMESDKDVEKHVKEIEKEFIYVDFPEEFRKIRDLLGETLKEDMEWLKERHYVNTTIPSRTMLIGLQKRMSARYTQTRNFIWIWPLIRSAEAIKLSHAIELIETQGVPFIHEYFQKTKKSKKKTDVRMMKHRKVMEAVELIEKLHEEELIHPKIDKLKEVVKDILKKKQDAKIIVFANFRSTVDRIRKMLEEEEVLTDVLVGQTMKNGSGMTQEKQIDVLKRFGRGEFNVLCGTSVSEEGIDIPAINYAVFYETVPSEIRAIQRRGRVGRQLSGKTVFLITKGTRDEAYFFASLNKENKMRKVLKSLQKGKKLGQKKSLIDWVKQDEK